MALRGARTADNAGDNAASKNARAEGRRDAEDSTLARRTVIRVVDPGSPRVEGIIIQRVRGMCVCEWERVFCVCFC